MTIQKKMLVFDMDGTIANLYGVPNWLEYLHAEDTTPYTVASPLYDMPQLIHILHMLKKQGWKIAVTTWLAKNGSKEYNQATSKAKKNWLQKFNFPYDKIHCEKYGTTKANCTRNKADFQILIDDNEKVRKGWHLGTTIDASKNIINELKALIN